MSFPFPAEEKLMGAIPANFASFFALGKRSMFPISTSIFAAVIISIPGMVIPREHRSAKPGDVLYIDKLFNS